MTRGVPEKESRYASGEMPAVGKRKDPQCLLLMDLGGFDASNDSEGESALVQWTYVLYSESTTCT